MKDKSMALPTQTPQPLTPRLSPQWKLLGIVLLVALAAGLMVFGFTTISKVWALIGALFSPAPPPT
jgi:hypothetical protein